MSIAYCKYNYVQYVQSAAFWQPVVLQSSCPVMPVLTEHGLEIAGLVRRGWREPQLQRLPCAQRCDHNIIKWKKAGNNGQGQGKEKSSLVMNGRVSNKKKRKTEKSHAREERAVACFRLYLAAATWSNYFTFNHTLEADMQRTVRLFSISCKGSSAGCQVEWNISGWPDCGFHFSDSRRFADCASLALIQKCPI